MPLDDAEPAIGADVFLSERALVIAIEVMRLTEGRGEFEQVRGLFASRARELAEWAIAAVGDEADGRGCYPVVMQEIADAARLYGDDLNYWATELAGRLPPATTLRLIGALLRALDTVPP